MKKTFKRQASRAIVYTLPLILLGTVNCQFDSTGGSGGSPGLGQGKPCMIAAVKFLLFEPGLGTEGPAIPGDTSLAAQCRDKAADTPFEWTLERQTASGDAEEIDTFSQINSVGLVPLEEDAPAYCIATAHIGSSVITDTLEGDRDIFDPDFAIGMFRITHTAPGWTTTCDFVEVTTCPNPLSDDPTPIWASHTTRDVTECEQGFAFVPHAAEPVENNIPFP